MMKSREVRSIRHFCLRLRTGTMRRFARAALCCGLAVLPVSCGQSSTGLPTGATPDHRDVVVSAVPGATSNVARAVVDVVSVSFTSGMYIVQETGIWALDLELSAAPSSDIEVSLAYTPPVVPILRAATGGGVDYTAGPGAVTVDSGRTAAWFAFEVTDDDLLDGTESFVVTLAVPDGYAVGEHDRATVFITDEEVGEARIAFGNDASSTEAYAVTVDEGGTLNVPVTVSHLPSESVTFEVEVLGDCADGIDFRFPYSKRRVTFGPEDASKTRHLTIDIARDSEDDDGETIKLRFAPADVVPQWNNLGDLYGRGPMATITVGDVEAPPPSPDREALRALYDATGGGKWTKRDNWLTDAPLGEWHGVGVDDDGRVVRLSLADNNLKGRLPEALGNLANLTELRLNRNNLKGRLPEALGNLANLTELRLNRNNLKGPLPEALLSLSRLKILHFGNNAGLCAPRTTAFTAWLAGIKTTSGRECN